MFEFAQTNLQLYRQMDELGYSLEDRERVASAYRFLMPMFSGQYRGTEKPFIAHLVGTASILASNRLPVNLVLVGLLHAVYMVGDFGFQPGTRQTRRKRRRIRNLAGADVEAVVASYDDMGWETESLRAYRSDDKTMPEPLGSAVKVQLANTLEDFLDHGVNYCAGSKLETFSSAEMQAEVMALSRLHGWPELCSTLSGPWRTLMPGPLRLAEPGLWVGRPTAATIFPTETYANYAGLARSPNTPHNGCQQLIPHV